MAHSEAQLNAANQQPAGSPHGVMAGDQLAPGRRILLLVHVNDNMAHAGYIDMKTTSDFKEAWKKFVPATKAYVKEVVPRGERIGRAIKLETLVLQTVDLATSVVLPNGNIPMFTGSMPAVFLNDMFHHPNMVDGVDAGVLHGLLDPLLGVPGHLLPAKALVITSVTHPGVVVARDRAVELGPVVAAALTFILSLVGA